MPEFEQFVEVLPSPAMQRESRMRSDHSPAWFAVSTTPRHEKRVDQHFAEREIEAYLPLYTETRRWRNRHKTSVALPLFPRYIFARIDPRDRVQVLSTPGVTGLVGCARELVAVPDDCIESLRRGTLEGKIRPHENVAIGDRVRIAEGPMAGVHGLLVRVKNDLRVIVRLDSIMQSVAVEVSIEEVERLS